jgi:LCP family protein required for cell wall assembly
VAAVLGVVLVVLAAAVTVDVLMLDGHIRHVDVSFPHGGTGTTYVIVGSDSRSSLPAGDPAKIFGPPGSVTGQHADVVVVVHVVGDRTSMFSVPRDTLVSPAPGLEERLTLTLLGGPQKVVDGLCRTLHITADHVVIVDFASFADIVDRVGGITVTLPHPVRDPVASLEIDTAGVTHLDGVQALALVRSRNPQWLIDGTWTNVPDGSSQRTDWTARVFDAVLHSAHGIGLDPVRLQALAWAATGSLTADQGTGLTDLYGLSKVSGPVQPLAGTPVANSLAVVPDGTTYAALAHAGYGATCTAP